DDSAARFTARGAHLSRVACPARGSLRPPHTRLQLRGGRRRSRRAGRLGEGGAQRRHAAAHAELHGAARAAAARRARGPRHLAAQRQHDAGVVEPPPLRFAHDRRPPRAWLQRPVDADAAGQGARAARARGRKGTGAVLRMSELPELPLPAPLSRSGARWDQEVELLARALPADLARALHERTDPGELLEIVLDLGREPEARVPGREVLLADRPVSASDLEHVTNNVGQFGEDNRAGIERTLHRVSAIRNRSGRITGLTMRVGRAVTGTGEIIRDIVVSGESILLLGRPGIGKTTILRDCARLLADELRKRVVIVDTSNEIGGDGDIPHPGIGPARRMQVRTPLLQHAVMIEAVENHMPEVIVIDEIGTELEAQAARTIAERGVQLIATAHGQTLENLLVN